MNGQLNRATFLYIVASVCLATGIFALTQIFPLALPQILTPWFIMILICEIVADLYPIIRFGFGEAQTEVTVSLGITFAVACIFPPEQAILLVLIQTVISDILTRKLADRIFFNAALYVAVIGGTSIIYHYFALPKQGLLEGPNLLATVLALIYYVTAESLLLSGLFSILSHKPLLKVLASFLKGSLPPFTALLPLGIALTELFNKNPLNILFLIPTFLFLYLSLKRERILKNQTEIILEKLVDVLESKSSETAQHSKRVRAWVEDICKELGLESGEEETILQAAALHDLGKVGINDELLRKPDISKEEFQHIKEHPGVSAALLEGLTLFEGGRNIVLHHHERYDGKGYPDQIAGEAIPLGARIITVADSFDAMISMRSYKRAKSRTIMEALEILNQERGTQFDPNLVTIFTKIVSTCLKERNLKNFPLDVQIDSKEEANPPSEN